MAWCSPYLQHPRQAVNNLICPDMTICINIHSMSLMPQRLLYHSSLYPPAVPRRVGVRMPPFALHPDAVVGNWSIRLRICIRTWCTRQHAWGTDARDSGESECRRDLM